MNWKAVSLAVLCATLAPGCAHDSAERRLDEKLQNETAVRNKAELRSEASTLIADTPGLTAQQRSELDSLRASTSEHLDKIAAESLRLRAVLIADVLAPKYDAKEVELVKKKLRQLSDERVATIIGAARDANMMFGRWASKSDRTTSDMLEELDYDFLEYR